MAFQHETTLRVRYGETDQMGYLYYGHYALYLEVGRTELIRSLGFPYRILEDEYKIMLPVKSMQMRFLRPAKYDDLITIRTSLQDFDGKNIAFYSELFNEAGKLLNVGEVRLVFVDANTMRSCQAPAKIFEMLKSLLENPDSTLPKD